MPMPYSLYLQWRMIWIALPWHASPQDMGQQLGVSEQTVKQYLKMFEETGDVKPRSRRSGPLRLFSKYEQLTLPRLILQNPGIYLHEIQQQLFHVWCGCQCFYNLYNPEICGVYSHQKVQHVALQWSEVCRATFMSESQYMTLQCLFG